MLRWWVILIIVVACLGALATAVAVPLSLAPGSSTPSKPDPGRPPVPGGGQSGTGSGGQPNVISRDECVTLRCTPSASRPIQWKGLLKPTVLHICDDETKFIMKDNTITHCASSSKQPCCTLVKTDDGQFRFAPPDWKSCTELDCPKVNCVMVPNSSSGARCKTCEQDYGCNNGGRGKGKYPNCTCHCDSKHAGSRCEIQCDWGKVGNQCNAQPAHPPWNCDAQFDETCLRVKTNVYGTQPLTFGSRFSSWNLSNFQYDPTGNSRCKKCVEQIAELRKDAKKLYHKKSYQCGIDWSIALSNGPGTGCMALGPITSEDSPCTGDGIVLDNRYNTGYMCLETIPTAAPA